MKLVVMDEADYNLLCQHETAPPLPSSKDEDDQEKPEDSPHHSTLTDGSVQTEQPQHDVAQEPGVTEQPDLTEQPQPGKDLTQLIGHLPPGFQTHALDLLRKLSETEGFQIVGDSIETDKQLVPDYSILQMLRETCVPMTKPHLPPLLKAFLRKHGITSFRNHLATKALSEWPEQKKMLGMYSLRKSTTGPRRGRGGGPKPYGRKRGRGRTSKT
jgi:hypothetical protein